MWQRVPPLVDPRAFDDPIRIEAEALEKVIVRNDSIGNVTAGADDSETQQTAASRSRSRPLMIEATMGH
jgi:hypothetical protein